MFLQRRAEQGAYSPHELCIEMSAEHALVDAAKVRVEPLPAETLSTFVHEYLHYLQNVSTVSGFAGYHASQQLLALFSATVDKTGRSAGSARLNTKEKERLRQICAYLAMLEGGGGPERAVLEAIKQVDHTPHELPFGEGVARLSEVTLTCEVETSQGERRDARLHLGLYVIEEGLAFEVDRVVAGIDGEPVDQDAAPSFPYLVLRMLGEHLAPGIERRDLIACGVLALLTNDPAGALIDALRDVGARRAQGASREDAIAAVAQATQATREGTIRIIILDDIEGLKKMHERRGAGAAAMARVGDIFQVLLQRRLEDPLWDVAPFRAEPIDHGAISEILERVEPCLVIQRMPDNFDDPQDDERPEHDLMLAFGQPGAATREMTKRAVPVLQCQIHYVNAHLPDTEFVASAQAAADGTPCPFYRSCTLELRRDNADICKTAPWEIYERSDKDTCWYGAGVAGTIGTVNLAPEALPRPRS